MKIKYNQLIKDNKGALAILMLGQTHLLYSHVRFWHFQIFETIDMVAILTGLAMTLFAMFRIFKYIKKGQS